MVQGFKIREGVARFTLLSKLACAPRVDDGLTLTHTQPCITALWIAGIAAADKNMQF